MDLVLDSQCPVNRWECRWNLHQPCCCRVSTLFSKSKVQCFFQKNSKFMLSCPLTKTRPSRPVNTEHMDPFSPKLACLWGTRSWQSAETWDFQRASPPRAALSGRTSSQLAQNRNVQRLRHYRKMHLTSFDNWKCRKKCSRLPLCELTRIEVATHLKSAKSIGWSEFIPAASSMSVLSAFVADLF